MINNVKYKKHVVFLTFMEKKSDLELAAETAFFQLQPAVRQYFTDMGLVPSYLRRPLTDRKTTPDTVDAIRGEIGVLCGVNGLKEQYDARAHDLALSYFASMLK